MSIEYIGNWVTRRDTVAPGVKAVVWAFGDGGVTAEFYTGDQPRIAERMDATYRLNGYTRSDDNRRTGPIVPPLITPEATTLCLNNRWAAEVLYIHTDLGRSFGPQPWARGIRPLIRAVDAQEWARGGHNDLLRYTPGGPEQGLIYARLIWRAAREATYPGMSLTAESLNEVVMGLGYGSLLTRIRAMLTEPEEYDMGRYVRNAKTAAMFDPPPVFP